MWRIDLEIDGLSIDAFVISCYPGGFCFDLPFNLGEIIKPPPRDVVKFCPFLLASDARRSMWDMDLVVDRLVVALTGNIDELKNQRSPRHDAASPGKKISADDVLEH